MQLADRRRLGGSRRGKSARAIRARTVGSPFREHFERRKMPAAASFGRWEPPRRRRSDCIVTVERGAEVEGDSDTDQGALYPRRKPSGPTPARGLRGRSVGARGGSDPGPGHGGCASPGSDWQRPRCCGRRRQPRSNSLASHSDAPFAPPKSQKLMVVWRYTKSASLLPTFERLLAT